MSQSHLLTPKQTHALFDILTHHETYSEIEAFKSTEAVLTHGFPFRTREQQALSDAAAAHKDIAAPTPTSGGGGGGGLTGFALSLWGRSSDSSAGATPTPSAPDSPRAYTPSSVAAEPASSSSGHSDGEGGEYVLDDADNSPSALPVMQLLTSTFVMRLPAFKALPRDFWAVRVQGLLTRLADADLSESYDKGAMGARKTLASGSGSVIEMIARGFLGGVPRRSGDETASTEETLKKKTYDARDGRELARAWDDVLDSLVYGNLVDAMFDYLARTDRLEAHSAAVDAASSYVVLHLAALLHHVFALSPDGPYLLKLLDGVHGLVPYRVIKQTLRVGNAATMIGGMMRLLLAKLSVTGLTNWLGVTQSDDDGMNLLQNIISLVLSRDAGEFKKAVQRVDKAGDDAAAGGLGEAVRAAIREHVASSKAQQAAVRRASVEAGESIVVAILRARGAAAAAAADGLSAAQHERALEYYSALLSMRDREAITDALCRHPPDLFTKAIREAIAAYNPVIRAVHERVDLGAHLSDLQEFITQFIRVSTPADRGGAPTVTVEDYVRLLDDHKPLLHRFVHAVARGCPDVWRDLRAWSNASIARFRQETGGGDGTTRGKSAMDEALDGLVAGLGAEARTAVLAAVDEHAAYLAALRRGSDARLAQLAGGGGGGECWGPGVYLARWQDILDDTLITPGGAGEGLRRGAEVRHLATLGKTGLAGGEIAAARRRVEPRAPDVEPVVRELGEQFGALMQAVNMQRRVFGKQ